MTSNTSESPTAAYKEALAKWKAKTKRVQPKTVADIRAQVTAAQRHYNGPAKVAATMKTTAAKAYAAKLHDKRTK